MSFLIIVRKMCKTQLIFTYTAVLSNSWDLIKETWSFIKCIDFINFCWGSALMIIRNLTYDFETYQLNNLN